MPPMTKFEPDKIYIHLHQMLPFLYIEEKFEYFRKMKDFTKREAKQPSKLSLGYSPDGASFNLRPLSIVMHHLKSVSVTNNHDDNDNEADVNDLADSIVKTMNIKNESRNQTIDSDSDQSTLIVFSSGSEEDDNETEVTMIEVPETDRDPAPMDNESQSSTSNRSHDQIRNNTTAQLVSLPEKIARTRSSKIGERSEEPANNKPIPSMPPSSMPNIDETDELVTHEEEDAIASESGSNALSGSLPNAAATNTAAIDDDEDWREIKLLVTKKMKKDHQLEQQHYQETLNATKTKMKKLEEKNKVLEKENEHWKISVRDANAKTREKNNELLEKTAALKKQLEEKEEAVKRLQIEYAAKIEAVKLELNEQWRNKRWCASCGKEIGAPFHNSDFCSFSCMRRSW